MILLRLAVVALPWGPQEARLTEPSPVSEPTPARAPALPSDEALDRALEGVSAERIREDLEYLASDELAGRDTPSPGLELAADYIEERLSELGFEHGARTGFVDLWTRSWVQLDTEESFLALEPVDGGEGAQRLSFGEGYFLVSPREMTDLSAEGELISVGDGSKSEVRKADLEGAWAVTVWPEGSILAVARRVQEEGAVGLLVLPVGEEAIGRLGNTTRTLSDGQFADAGEGVFPAPVLGVEATDRLLAPFGGHLPDAGESFGVRAEERRRTTHPGGLRTFENVCGLWPGDHSKLSKEVIIISAHYDHVGRQGGEIHNGADDNASGTTGLLAIAEALHRHGPMKRSVLLMWVSGEEKGLWGSEAWTRRPWLPEGHRPVCNLNIDMIGRNAPEHLCITPTRGLAEHYNGLTRLAEQHAGTEGFGELRSADAYWRRSDHMNFAVHLGLPVAFLFADIHEDYHKPTDDADRIDYDKIRRVARLVLRMLDGLQKTKLDLHRKKIDDVDDFQEKVFAGWVEGDQELLVAALRAHRMEHGALPDSLDDLDTTIPSIERVLGGGVPLDPWGRPYRLDTKDGEVVCLGADGRKGGRGERADTSLAIDPR